MVSASTWSWLSVRTRPTSVRRATAGQANRLLVAGGRVGITRGWVMRPPGAAPAGAAPLLSSGLRRVFIARPPSRLLGQCVQFVVERADIDHAVVYQRGRSNRAARAEAPT